MIMNKFYLRKGFKMKKWLISILSLLAVLCICSVSAATLIPSQQTRNIKLQKTTANNSSVQGVSATTGLPSNNLTYIPILTQIDNNLEAIPQWGISFADIMYELPIQGQGWTRLTALFSDRYPQEAGPVRSGRVMHADLR
jgi:predicted PurR-regulated permease PerM